MQTSYIYMPVVFRKDNSSEQAPSMKLPAKLMVACALVVMTTQSSAGGKRYCSRSLIQAVVSVCGSLARKSLDDTDYFQDASSDENQGEAPDEFHLPTNYGEQ